MWSWIPSHVHPVSIWRPSPIMTRHRFDFSTETIVAVWSFTGAWIEPTQRRIIAAEPDEVMCRMMSRCKSDIIPNKQRIITLFKHLVEVTADVFTDNGCHHKRPVAFTALRHIIGQRHSFEVHYRVPVFSYFVECVLFKVFREYNFSRTYYR